MLVVVGIPLLEVHAVRAEEEVVSGRFPIRLSQRTLGVRGVLHPGFCKIQNASNFNYFHTKCVEFFFLLYDVKCAYIVNY